MALNVTFCRTVREEMSTVGVYHGEPEEVAVAASRNESSGCPAGHNLVRCYAAENTRIYIGAASGSQPSAGDGVFLPSGSVEYFRITAGQVVGTFAPA